MIKNFPMIPQQRVCYIWESTNSVREESAPVYLINSDQTIFQMQAIICTEFNFIILFFGQLRLCSGFTLGSMFIDHTGRTWGNLGAESTTCKTRVCPLYNDYRPWVPLSDLKAGWCLYNGFYIPTIVLLTFAKQPLVLLLKLHTDEFFKSFQMCRLLSGVRSLNRISYTFVELPKILLSFCLIGFVVVLRPNSEIGYSALYSGNAPGKLTGLYGMSGIEPGSSMQGKCLTHSIPSSQPYIWLYLKGAEASLVYGNNDSLILFT